MSALVVRQLVAADAVAFRDIRLEGLRVNPEAFGSTYDSEARNGIDAFEGTIGRNFIAGAFMEGTLVGVAGLYVLQGPKVGHRGNIWGVFVRPPARGHGVGRALLELLLEHARQRVRQVHLSVVTTNPAAVALYQRHGFVTYGTEPRALLVEGTPYDEHLMVCVLDEAAR